LRKSIGVISAFLLAAVTVFGQQYNIRTVAGGAPIPNAPSAGSASIGNPGAMASDLAGNIYFVSDDCVFRVDTTGGLTRMAGTSQIGFSGDGGSALQAQLNNPLGLAVDSNNNIYIADTGNSRIRKVVIGTGVITTIAGLPTAGYSGNNGQASGAALNAPQGLAVDTAGNLYIADTGNNVIRQIIVASGIINTVAGNGAPGTSGDGQPATAAQLNAPTGVSVDTTGNIYIADSKNNRIREVQSGIMSTIAGTGVPGFSGDFNLATSAQLQLPTVVNWAQNGVIYLLDSNNFRVRQILPNKVISTVAGGGGSIPANSPQGITTDPSSNLFVADGTHFIFKSTPAFIISSFAGNGLAYSIVDNVPGPTSQLVLPEGLAVDATGTYIADRGEARIRKTIAGGNIISPPGGTAIGPAGVAVDPAGNMYIADAGGNVLVKVSNGAATTIAGNGTSGAGGDNGLATNAQLNQPNGVAVDNAGNVYIADTLNHKIRKITVATGVITTIAGNNSAGFAGDNGPSTSSVLNQPSGLVLDSASNLYIADTGNNRIRKITAATGVITTVAGNGSQSSSGDGGAATSASIASPHAVGVDSLLNLYIPDYGGRVRKVSVSGLITTIAGNGTQGYSGDNGPATNAQLNQPWGIAVDGSGNVFVSDIGNQSVRVLNPVAASQLSILTTSLPSGTVGMPYAQALSATGGTSPYTWSVAIGSLPSGLTLSPSGSISGTPTGTSAQFTVQVTDSASVTAQTTLVIIINPANANGLTITSPATLPSGAIIAGVGLPYSQTLTATSGNPPYTWTLVSGSLPAGLNLAPTGQLFGTPQSPGTSSFTIRVNDISNAISTQNFTLQVISTGSPARTGVLGHIAAGGVWTTRAYLTNISASPLAVNLAVHTDDGSIVPLNVAQQGATQVFNGNLFTGVMNPNSTIVVDMGAGLPNTATGWIDVLTTGAANSMAGFAIFRNTLNSSGAVSEGTSPLQTQFESKMDVNFDNTGGYNTDLAIVNLSTSATTVTATVLDQNGNLLGTYSLSLNGNGHTAFIFPNQFGVTANQQGLVQFVSNSGGSLAGVGLRANTGAATGSFTSVPVILP
jgi:sugar lactone lactonase YvrE